MWLLSCCDVDITCMVVMLRNQEDIVRDYLAEGERARLAAEGAQSEECSSSLLEPPPLASHARLTQKRGSLTTGLVSHTGGSNSWQAGTGKQTSPHRNSFCSSRPRLPNKPQLSVTGVVHSSAATSSSGSGSSGQMGANANSLGASASSTSVSVPYQRGRSSSQPQELIEQTINKMSKASIGRRSVSTKSGRPPAPSPSPFSPPVSKTATAAAKTSGKLKTHKSSSSERKLSQ